MAKKNTKTVKKADRAKQEQTEREIFGVCFIALAVFLAAGMYTDMVGVVGSFVRNFMFGMLGIAGYAAPVILAALGILSIIMSKSDSTGSTLWLILGGIVCLLVIIHTAVRGSINSPGVLAYYSDAYLYGKSYCRGGGLLGALFAYPSKLLLGEVGTYIFFGAAIVIIFLIATRLSIKAMGVSVGTAVKSGVETVSEKIHHAKTEHDYDYDEDIPVVQPKGGKGLYTDPYGQEELKLMPTKKTNRKRPEKVVVRRMDEDSTQKKNWEGDISFLPSSGAIPTKKQPLDDDPFDILAEVDDKDILPLEEIPYVEPDINYSDEEIPYTDDLPDDNSDIIVGGVETPEITPQPPVYEFPPISCLKRPAYRSVKGMDSPAAKGKKLEETLASFNIDAKVINYSVGPTITRFELHPAQGIRVNRITSLSDDIALALAAPRVRIEAPIPGKSAIGIEIPNKDTVPVLLREVIESPEFTEGNSALRFGLGKDIAGNVVCADLDRMPHLLIAGSTGSGKSVCINDIILSFVYGKKPEDVRLIMIDPKKVELRVYSPLPHLLMPVVTDAKKAAGALKWAVMEMDQRYLKMSKVNARDLNRYNSLQKEDSEKMPRLVIIIDELADLMMVAAKEVEESICRIAQLGRAAGIHLIVATQRPSADIITGLIKANIPSRIALMVSSAVDSRVIMDASGAEKLLGRGDMLFHANGASKPVRAQAAFVSDEEVESVMDFFAAKQQEGTTGYSEISLEEVSSVVSTMGQGNGKQEDDLIDDAVKIVLESGQASISMIQRRLRVGYARAARLIDIMEQMHVVSGFDGSKPRKLLINSFEEYRQLSSGNSQEDMQ